MNGFELQRLDHVSLSVGDRQRSIAWYRDVLGLGRRGEAGGDDQPVFMGEFGACVALFQAHMQSGGRRSESTGLRHIAFILGLDDLGRAQAHLRDQNVEFRSEDHGNARSVYLADLDGHVIKLTTHDR
jgi:catechol-2,3-dioxygenase